MVNDLLQSVRHLIGANIEGFARHEVDIKRSFDEPDETVEFGGVTEQLISLGGLTLSRSVQPLGWDWHTTSSRS